MKQLPIYLFIIALHLVLSLIIAAITPARKGNASGRSRFLLNTLQYFLVGLIPISYFIIILSGHGVSTDDLVTLGMLWLTLEGLLMAWKFSRK